MLQILVVEDEVIVGMALREELQDWGATVTVANDAEEGRRALLVTRFAAAIIDVGLPVTRGDVFAKECRQQFHDMPIILATGMHERELRASFEDDPKLEILEKPHHFSSVRATFERLGIVFPANGGCHARSGITA